ncbi:hypothetical protein JX265_007265 [Neoarthrinium moseri]|uniref:Cytochrome P450 n=1 Tax=Neoarthrinium moseri TaxID=1658444 RepID=A0A9P9WK33_9PEZI|nr:uncharacterized protein JN550_012104 [Neoarthrinium moseri]KAI1850940.1 hypothetical protein JX266_003605 [Neoarthrinium moseri]KAI1859295.1 hypothetical protein JN550_012104 [Neoarthrinium moseri]KAI1867463.1 hypothetical protein JX265_007265 [Neoarthrinium moseri]
MDIITRPAVLAPALLIAGYLVYQILRPSTLPRLPIVGSRPGEWFPLVKARWRNAKDMRTSTLVAYQQHRDEACLLPIAGGQDFVLLPLQEMQWLLDQPDSIFSNHAAIKEDLQLDLVVRDPGLIENPLHNHLIATKLTRETGNLIPDLFDELQTSFEEIWGRDTVNFKQVVLWESMQLIIGRVTNRVFVGLPMCRNSALLEMGIACARDLPMAAAILRFFWGPIRPLVALLLTLPFRIHSARFCRILKPEITRRLQSNEARQNDPEGKALRGEPNDFLQWSIHQAKASGDPHNMKPQTLASRIMLLNFASIHTSSFAITHVLFDLLASKKEYIEELREEVREVLAAHDGQWDKRTLAALPKLDSTMRESQRLNSFATIATSRTVIAPKGVKTPSGVELSPGTRVCGPSFPVFHDGDIYPDPYEFRPFRFAEKRSTTEGSYVDKARQAWPTTSTEYTAFGHGRHACPGRFFASSELKLMLAYILLHYDFEMQEKRPENVWFGLQRVPPLKASLRFRRRDAP